MEILKQLPKDLAYMVSDYLKDKKNYDLVLDEMCEKMTDSMISIHIKYHLPMFLNDDRVLDIILNKHNTEVYNEFLSEIMDR